MSNKFLENNKALIKNNIMGLKIAEYLQTLSDYTEKIKKINGQLHFEYDGTYYLLHSRNELKEAEKMLQNIDEEKDYLLFIYGMGNLTLIRKLIKNTSEHTKILLVEENPYVLQYYMHTEKIEDILENEKLVYAIGEENIYKTTIQS